MVLCGHSGSTPPVGTVGDVLTWIAAALVIALVISLYKAFPVLREWDQAFGEWFLGVPRDRF